MPIMKPKLKVVQLRSGAAVQRHSARSCKGLGLRGPRKTVIVDNTPAFRGTIKKVLHLVTVEECDG